jgi:hypothetical protein
MHSLRWDNAATTQNPKTDTRTLTSLSRRHYTSVRGVVHITELESAWNALLITCRLASTALKECTDHNAALWTPDTREDGCRIWNPWQTTRKMRLPCPYTATPQSCRLKTQTCPCNHKHRKFITQWRFCTNMFPALTNTLTSLRRPVVLQYLQAKIRSGMCRPSTSLWRYCVSLSRHLAILLTPKCQNLRQWQALYASWQIKR